MNHDATVKQQTRFYLYLFFKGFFDFFYIAFSLPMEPLSKYADIAKPLLSALDTCTKSRMNTGCHGHLSFFPFFFSTFSGRYPRSVSAWPGWHGEWPFSAGLLLSVWVTGAQCSARGICSDHFHSIEGAPSPCRPTLLKHMDEKPTQAHEHR